MTGMTEQALERALGHRFADRLLLRTALTHRSHSVPNNERLEFIGDALLDCVIALELFERFGDLPEGDLSRLRAHLVCQESLHQLALKLDLSAALRLGEGELKSGGHRRPSILADALEALFAAIYLDAGFAAVRNAIVAVFGDLLTLTQPGETLKDAKTRLQEYLQGRRLQLPRYTLIATQGAAHAQQFKVACDVDALKLHTEGEGASRRAAEQMAAEEAMRVLAEIENRTGN